MCLTRPDEVVSWVGDEPASALAFSGWLKVERRFELHRLELTVREIVRSHANINIAIRLPEGANPVPSHSFWRRLLLVWDE